MVRLAGNAVAISVDWAASGITISSANNKHIKGNLIRIVQPSFFTI
jgi:hypothetical protein